MCHEWHPAIFRLQSIWCGQRITALSRDHHIVSLQTITLLQSERNFRFISETEHVAQHDASSGSALLEVLGITYALRCSYSSV